jgi:large subunit ribosomal protein L3
MIKKLYGEKIKQSHTFTENGKRIPVTIIGIPTHRVAQVLNEEKEGYLAIRVFLEGLKNKSKKVKGIFREIKIKKEETVPELKTEIKPTEVFAIGDEVSVTGITKGKGFQGGVKRHGFHGGPKTHGQSDRERAPGSIGSTTTPGRVYKGKRMAGHMGTTQSTTKGLEIIAIDDEKKLLTVKGLVPGYSNNIVSIQKK